MEATSMRFLNSVFTFLMMFMFLSPALAGQRMYVTDRIVLDMYEDSSRISPVLKQLPTGTAIKTEETNGPFTRVTTTDGTSGWVEGSFLTDEKPIQVLYTELNSKYRKSLDRIDELEASSSSDKSDSSEESKDIGWMRGEMKKARKAAKEMESKLKETGVLLADSGNQLDILQTENVNLREQLNNLATDNASGTNIFNQAPLGSQNTFEDDSWSIPVLWAALGILVFLIIGIFSGIAILDYRIRQRHGGFRVY